MWYPFLFPSFFISVRLCFCGKCLSFPAMCQNNNPLPNTRCGSRNRASLPRKSTSLSRRHRLHVFFLMNAANFVKIKQDIISLKTSISCFTLLKQTNSWNKFWTLKQDVISMKTSLLLHIVSNSILANYISNVTSLCPIYFAPSFSFATYLWSLENTTIYLLWNSPKF